MDDDIVVYENYSVTTVVTRDLMLLMEYLAPYYEAKDRYHVMPIYSDYGTLRTYIHKVQ
ncbi:MAG: hypothetical protein ACR2PH_17900 [Desulfobulbia bacterium]